jgi:hypothetical protein
MSYENNLIIKKMIELEKHHSDYHPKKIKMQPFPTTNGFLYKNKVKNNNINRENKV